MTINLKIFVGSEFLHLAMMLSRLNPIESLKVSQFKLSTYRYSDFRRVFEG